MNIFILDIDPHKSAQYLCDKHVLSQMKESAQLLCSAFEPGVAPYRRTHYNHPCAKWVRESEDNFNWLFDHAYAINREYMKRFSFPKTGVDIEHKSFGVCSWALSNVNKLQLPKRGLTPFAQAMPEECKREDPVEAYRMYYLTHKQSIAKWDKDTPAPNWWKL